MTSASKIAANRRNAAKSTGPRSAAGKCRTRRNAARHGLARATFDADDLARIETLAREFLEPDSNFIDFELVRMIVRAELDLERIRRLRVGMINTAALSMTGAEMAGETPLDQPTAAMTRVLPELIKIDRYERQAAARRDRAVRDLMTRRHLVSAK